MFYLSFKKKNCGRYRGGQLHRNSLGARVYITGPGGGGKRRTAPARCGVIDLMAWTKME